MSTTELLQKNWKKITNDDNEETLDEFAHTFYTKLFEENPGKKNLKI